MKRLLKRKFVDIFCLTLSFGPVFSSVVQAQQDQGYCLPPATVPRPVGAFLWPFLYQYLVSE